ncbi:MAG: electron transport complex subunit RsxC [Gammaproteobacteria bacterium]|nr:MAG: electron transport complex subunit RsxC [Gammaproteobacteria bacterium]
MDELRHPIWDFHGGLHVDDRKALSNGSPIRQAAVPKRLQLPLQQHIGRHAEPVVEVGERVLKGQLIARASDYVSANIHAPTSGVVTEIAELPIAHPSGLPAMSIVIEADGEDRWAELPEPIADYRDTDPADLRERLRWAGIVGLGGAVFPTSVKTNVTGRKVDTLIINAAECEPYITCDDRLMREQPAQVIAGAEILCHIVGASQILIGIEDNKPEAIAALRETLSTRGPDNIQLRVVPTKYPSGGEKQLIYLLTGVEVPSQGLPLDVGMVCQNVATAAAVADAVLQGRPLISRIVTVTGQAVAQPGNLEALIGTPVSDLIDQCGGYRPSIHKLIMGGPMMGFGLPSDNVPVTKGSNCLIAATAEESPDPVKASPCIRCGECVKVCPAQLLPQQLYWYARARDFDKTQDHHLFDCIECGCCAYVCPAHIPLVHYYRFAKTEIWASEREREKAEHARRRHEFREARLKRLEEERKARLRKKKEALAKKPEGGKDPKKAAIEAAMQRVAAKKAAQASAGVSPENEKH